jgi:hypothetical protein
MGFQAFLKMNEKIEELIFLGLLYQIIFLNILKQIFMLSQRRDLIQS